MTTPEMTSTEETTPGIVTAGVLQLRPTADREANLAVVADLIDQAAAAGVFYNTATIFVSGERRLDYRKSHLPLSFNFPEKSYFRPGDKSPEVVDADGIPVSTIICYERHFPELARTAAVQGATVLGIPIAATGTRVRHSIWS